MLTAYTFCCNATNFRGFALKDDVGELDTGLALQELEAPDAGPPKNNNGVLARKLSKPTVFIVDDDDACRDSVRELMISVGLLAAVFSSAFEFLAAFDATWRGCLVLDVRMPRMNGLALQQRLVEMGACLPIVFISGSVDIETAVQAIRDGAVDFLEKPYPQQQLLDAIYTALRRNSTSRQEHGELHSGQSDLHRN